MTHASRGMCEKIVLNLGTRIVPMSSLFFRNEWRYIHASNRWSQAKVKRFGSVHALKCEPKRHRMCTQCCFAPLCQILVSCVRSLPFSSLQKLGQDVHRQVFCAAASARRDLVERDSFIEQDFLRLVLGMCEGGKQERRAAMIYRTQTCGEPC